MWYRYHHDGLNVFVAAKIYVGAGKRDYVPEDKRVPVGGEK